MVLKPKGPNNGKNIGDTNLSQVQKSFKERVFCLAGEGMQMKMKALDLSEFDFESIFSTENEISQYLEIVDLYFQELYMVKKYLDDLYAHQYADYEGEDKNEIIHSTSVNNLKYFIASFDELKNIFSYKKDTPIDVIKIYNHGRIQDFSKFIASTQKNNLSFDWDDAIKFFSIENDTTMNGKNVIGKLYGAYIHLSKVIFDQELLKNILKMAANSEHSYTIHFLNTLETMSDGEMKLLEKYYPDMVMLGILAGKNVHEFFRTGLWKTKIFESKQKQEIIKGFQELGPDFVYIYADNSGFLTTMLELYPTSFWKICRHLKKIADLSSRNEVFYMMTLRSITDFVRDNPDGWEYLEFIATTFGTHSPAILGEGINIVDIIYYKHFDKRFEIIQEIFRISTGFQNGTDTLFLSSGLRFFSQMYHRVGCEKMLEMMESMQKFSNEYLDENNKNIFYSYATYGEKTGLHILMEYCIYFPDEFEEGLKKILSLISKHISVHMSVSDEPWGKYFAGMTAVLGENIFTQDKTVFKEMLSFFDKVGSRKSDMVFIERLQECQYYINISPQSELEQYKMISTKMTFPYVLAYLLKYKKTKVMSFIKILHLMKDLELRIDFETILFGGMSLEYYEEDYVKILFAGETVDVTKIWKNFVRIGGKQHHNYSDMRSRIQSIVGKSGKQTFQKDILPTLKKIQNVFADLILKNLQSVIKRKIHIKFKNEFHLTKDFPNVLINENLVEFYKMYCATTKNKQEAQLFLSEYFQQNSYIQGDNIETKYPYSRRENKKFLIETFGEKSHIWLSKRERIYEVKEHKMAESSENLDGYIQHHFQVSLEKLQLLGVQQVPQDYEELIKLFDTQYKKEKSNFDATIFADLELQVKSIKNFLQSRQSKKLEKVKIYHELNPLKIAMMGNWVDGSCLSYYNSVGNYWSAITNALEVNKGVFYFEDENGNIIARILVGVDKNGNLEIHPPYIKGTLDTNIKPYFVDYITSLAHELGKNLSGDRNEVQILFCDDWYKGD